MPRRGTAARGSSKRRKYGGRRVIGTPGFTRNVGNYGRYPKSKELKYHDTDVTIPGIAVAGSIIDTLNGVEQNTTEKTRVGRKIFIKRVQLRGEVSLPGLLAAGQTSTHGARVRVIMYLDKQANGAAATPGVILQTTDINSWRDMEHVDRFRILYDKVHTLNRPTVTEEPAGTFQSPTVVKNFSMGKNCNIEILYSSPSGDVGNVQSNNIGMLFLSTETLITEFTGTARIRYTD
nr:hypothetical protein [uncultured bacterium]AUH21338.1 hypothetical protein [uncultured bacterium]AUH21344.1 hypothetical protein [uncultured bacterium]AUH21350.1 hypothetical protein [uncultured bacterium]